MAESALARMESLGREGFTVSVCCGPCGSRVFAWTVSVLSPDGRQEFDQPFAARDFEHAVWIAETEIAARGWRQFGRGKVRR